jgi:hypothetical protein
MDKCNALDLWGYAETQQSQDMEQNCISAVECEVTCNV